MSEKIHAGQLASAIMEGLEEYAELAVSDMKESVRKAANGVKSEIASTAPRHTGKYAKSWTAAVTKENANALTMTVHSKNRYQLAHLLEHGHAKRGGGRVAAQPHIAAAEEKGAAELEREIERKLSHG
ncbi:MAG: HK97 gp10 family phage protein [Oscillospiraceae bacterium]|nr:HK97 gp10 family phage protein [Oscillospiraceae bacterium]